MLTEEDKKMILAQAAVLPGEKQKQRQSQAFGAKKELFGDILQKILGIRDSATDIQNFFNNLRGKLPYDQKTEIAIVLGRADELIGHTVVGKYDTEDHLLFERNDIDYLSEENTIDDMDRQAILKKIFQEHIIDTESITLNHRESESNIYMVSALGCSASEKPVPGQSVTALSLDGPYNPIRIGEPFVRMVMSLMERLEERDIKERGKENGI